MASQLSDKIQEDFLECKICFEVYRNPRTLFCLHSFCEPCLEQLMNKQDGSVTCPDCRTVSDLKGSVLNAKASFFINSLLDLFHSKTTKETPCSVCLVTGVGDVPASSRCLDCADFLCPSCARGHCLSKLTVDHGVVSLADYATGCHDDEARLKQERRCPIHGEPLRFFCSPCARPICGDCRMLEHFSHQVQSLAQAATARRPQLEMLIGSLDGSIQSLTHKEQEVDGAIRQLKEAGKVIEDQLSEHISAIIEEVFAQKIEVSKQLATLVEQQEKKCLSIKEDLCLLMSSAVNTREFSTQVLQKGKDYEVLDLEETIQSQVERIQKMSMPEIDKKIPILVITKGPESDWIRKDIFQVRFDTDSDSLEKQTTCSTVADPVLTTSVETAPGTSSQQPAAAVAEEQQEQRLPNPWQYSFEFSPISFNCIRYFNVRDDDDENEENITGLSLFPSRDIVIADNANYSLKRVIRSGIVRKAISTEGRGWDDLDPFSVAVCDDSIFFTSGSKLYKVPDSDDQDIMQVCNLRGNHEEYSIAAYENEYIVVSEGTSCCLSLYSPEGILVGRVTPYPCDGKFVFLAVNSREEFIVSDTMKKCVLIITRSGNILNTYSSSSFRPTSVCTDKYDYIYVLNGRQIILLDPLGNFMREALSFNNFTPKLITADEHGHLIMVNRKGNFRIYRVIYAKLPHPK